MTTTLCRQCSGDLTHPTEIRTGLCVVCYFDNLRPAEPLPPSDYYQMDLATRDMVDGRQQTEMAGER